MLKVCKNKGNVVEAYCLGTGHEMEKKLCQEGKIKELPNGQYELFSQESHSGTGEIASSGDYFKIDSEGCPYPNKKKWFEGNHVHLEGDRYRQIPEIRDAWKVGEPMNEVLDFLLGKKLLKFCPENQGQYFETFREGTILTAAEDAVVVFYHVERDAEGNLTDVNFNFVARKEFDLTYSVVE